MKKLVFRNERDVDDVDLRSEQNVIDMLYKEKVIPVRMDIKEKFIRLDDLK